MPIGARCRDGTYPPVAVMANGSIMRTTDSMAPSGSASIGMSLMSGPGSTSVRSAATLWVMAGPGGRERILRQVADIAVAVELPPGPAFLGGLVDGHALALERLGVERAIGRGRAPQRRHRFDDLARLARDEARSRDLAFEMLGGEIGPRRRQPGIGRHAGIERVHAVQP